jgi:hypothetical protein
MAESFYGYKPSDLLPCCKAGCPNGTKCELGWEQGGDYLVERVIGTCGGTSGNGTCDIGEIAGDPDCQPPDINPGGSPCGENAINYERHHSICGDGICDREGYTRENFGACPQDCGWQFIIDIKFCNNPNTFNCKKKGVLPVTIFGLVSLDVADIDIETLQLCLDDDDLSTCTGKPREWSIVDRGSPRTDIGAEKCAKAVLNPDGYDDLEVVFEAREVREILGDFCEMGKGATSPPLTVIGSTLHDRHYFSWPFPDAGVDQLRKVNK